MSDPTIVPAVQTVATDVNAALDTPAVQALSQAVEAEVAPKIPVKVRAVIYETLKWVSLVGAAATATAASALHGDAQLYVATGGFVLTTAVSQLAKVHVGK